MPEQIVVKYEKPANWTPRQTSLAGEELPAEVTAQPVTIGVYASTEGTNEAGRPYGYVAYSVAIAGRADPELTADEREYVARLLDHAAADFRSGRALGPDTLVAISREPEGQ